MPFARAIDLRSDAMRLPQDGAVAALSSARRKLWDPDSGFHCSIIGTCLTLDELRGVARKAGLNFPAERSGFELHGYFVRRACERSALSKLLNKALERKYATDITRAGRCKDEAAVFAAWQAASQAGQIAGAFWALMTHPAASNEFRSRAHADVHMLSHLQGAVARADVARQRQLELHCADLETRLERTRRHAETTLAERDARIAALEERGRGAEPDAARIAVPVVVAAPAGRDARLAARLATLERRLRIERARARAAEQQAAQLGEQLQAVSRAESLARSVIEEPATMQLDGRCLLYVGGRRHLAPHLRAIVERCDGEFLYHDGGMESANARLDGLVSRAEIVFCPVDCVSHDACLRLKALCRQIDKPFVPLRSASLSAFVSAIRHAAHGRFESA